MTSPQAEPSSKALSETLADLAVQVAALRGQVSLINKRLDAAGLTGDLDLAARFDQLAETVDDALDAAAPRGPAAPYWIGLDRDAYTRQLGDLRRWADIILRQQYGGYELRDCWANHPHAIWELSTLAAQWHRTYGGKRPDLGQALEFYDRWLPGTMRRIAVITRNCVAQCVIQAGSWYQRGQSQQPTLLSTLRCPRTIWRWSDGPSNPTNVRSAALPSTRGRNAPVTFIKQMILVRVVPL